MPTRPEWYADGLRFECTMCGACCTGPAGYVKFTDAEAERIAQRIGVDLETFYKQYTRRTRAGRSLAEVKTDFGYDCIFLDRDSVPGKAICGIHDVRPTQCQTFPWWPENLRSKNAWRKTAKQCEGVGQGPVVPIEQIRIERDRTPT